MARIRRRVPRKAKDPLAPFYEAEKQVGGTAFARTQWVTNFARQHQSGSPHKVQTDLQWKALAFAKGIAWDVRVRTVGAEEFPSWSTVRDAGAMTLGHLNELRDRGATHIQPRGWAGDLLASRSGVKAYTMLDGVSFLDAFLVRLYAALAGLKAEHAHLRFCVDCRQAFVSKREDRKTCSPSCRTKAWRKAHREAFRVNRRRYYDRRTRAAKGLGPNVQIGRKPRVLGAEPKG